MKLFGKKLSGPNIEFIVLPRGDGNDIIIKAQAVLDMTDFIKILPPPEPPKVMIPGGGTSVNIDDAGFQTKLMDWSTKKTYYLILKSLQATEGLEWETVEMANPNTWGNFTKELSDGGFTDSEQAKIVECAMKANALSDSHLEEARKRFLASRPPVVAG